MSVKAGDRLLTRKTTITHVASNTILVIDNGNEFTYSHMQQRDIALKMMKTMSYNDGFMIKFEIY